MFQAVFSNIFYQNFFLKFFSQIKFRGVTTVSMHMCVNFVGVFFQCLGCAQKTSHRSFLHHMQSKRTQDRLIDQNKMSQYLKGNFPKKTTFF